MLLSESFPTIQAAYTEAINLRAILNLPKGTEHFMSDLHGEQEAFAHIVNNCSGVVRERVMATFGEELGPRERDELCTLIYYPKEKLARVHAAGSATDEWYVDTLMRLVRLARFLSGNYTRSKVRKAMPVEYAYIIDELLHAAGQGEVSRHNYHESIVESIVKTGSADDFICSLASLIKRLAVDRLHIVGDVFDRGPHADRVLDKLMAFRTVDVQWGNHDICWMGAAAGSEACVASVVRSNVRYGSLDVLESAYGVSLRELALFAERTYRSDDVIKAGEKAIDVILLKLEGQLIERHPGFSMDGRLLLDKIDLDAGTVRIDDADHPLKTRDLPTIDPADPYALTDGERRVVDGLVRAFQESDRLRRHVDFLYDHGSVYLACNGNLLFHGCIPMTEDGGFAGVECEGVMRSGRDYLDFCDRIARRAWTTGDEASLDWMWYLWCGRLSPLSGRVVKTFERAFVDDPETWPEPRDPYWVATERPEACEAILREFGLDPSRGHIINGHTPVRAGSGESPVRAGGRLIVIDGGFCKAYHSQTGIAGYTLIADSDGMRLKAHRPFTSVDDALDRNADILSNTRVLEVEERPLLVSDTDTGERIREQIADLTALLEAYRTGDLPERERRLSEDS